MYDIFIGMRRTMSVIGDLLRQPRLSEVFVPRLLLFGGMLGTLIIAAILPNDVFYSGDGGVKWLMVQQYLAGDFGVDLRLTATESVQRIWQDGHYPFGPPFVYQQGGRWVISFPPLFALLSTPFVGLLGFKGVYVVPLVSLYGVWYWCYRIARRINLGGWSVCLLLLALIIASPLAIYGTIFWEHTLGVLLGLASVAWLLSATRPEGVSCQKSALLGFVFGLTPWVRPEAYCMWAIFCALSLGAPQLRRQRQTWCFVGASMAVVLLLWLSNALLYGNPLGVHSLQIIQHTNAAARLLKIESVLREMTTDLLTFFPLTWLFLLWPLGWWCTRKSWCPFDLKITISDKIFWATAVLSVVAISMIVPNAGGSQHGPRYLLILLPPMALLATRIFDALWRSRHAAVRWTMIAAAFMLVLGGGQKNSYTGFKNLVQGYRYRTVSALQLLRQSESPVVLVSHQYVAQELSAAMPDKIFVRTTARSITSKLAQQLSAAGHRNLLLVGMRTDVSKRSFHYVTGDDGFRIDGRPLGIFGMFQVHRIRLSPL